MRLSRPSKRVHHMRIIVTRRKTQTRSCGSNFRMRPERDDTETIGPRGLGKGDVRGVVEVLLGEHLPKPTRREEVALRRGSKHEVAQCTVNISRPERTFTPRSLYTLLYLCMPLFCLLRVWLFAMGIL
jgi:hypothetical protein